MTAHRCGCATEPASPEERCALHRGWWCHGGQTMERGELWCPPCYRARLRSVYIDPKATPTRSKG